MRAETLEAYRPLLRSILSLESFHFENVFSFRVKGEEIVDALSGKSQFFDIGTKGNKLLKSLYQQWKATQRPPSIVLKDHIMSIFPIQEDVDGIDFLGMLRERSDGELSQREASLVQLLCSELSLHPEGVGGAPSGGSGSAAEVERLQTMLEGERNAYQVEMRQVLIRTRELEESLRVAEENVASFQRMAEELQDAAAREQQLRVAVEDELRMRNEQLSATSAAVPSPEQAERIRTLELEKLDLAHKFERLDAEHAKIRGILERIQEERSEESIQHSNEIDTLMGDLSQTQVRERELTTKIEELQTRLQSAGGASKAEVDGLRMQVEQIRDALTTKESELSRSGDQLRKEREISTRLLNEMQSLQGERSQHAAKLASVEAQTQELRQRAERAEEIESEMVSLREERDQLNADLAAAQIVAERVEEVEESLQLMQGRFQEASDLLGAVMKSRDKYRTALDSLINPVFVLDRNLVVLHLNRAMLTYTQEHQFQHIIGKRCYEALGLPGICQDCPILKAIESGRVEGSLVTMQMPAEKKIFSVAALPTLDANSNITAITEFMEDVTDRLAVVERIRQVNEEKRQLSAQVEGDPLGYFRLLLDAVGLPQPSEEPAPDLGTDFAIKLP